MGETELSIPEGVLNQLSSVDDGRSPRLGLDEHSDRDKRHLLQRAAPVGISMRKLRMARNLVEEAQIEQSDQYIDSEQDQGHDHLGDQVPHIQRLRVH